MKEPNQDRIWELASLTEHGEASESEQSELKELTKLADNKKIADTVAGLHAQLKNTTPVHHSSIIDSWNHVAQFIKNKKLRAYYTFSKYAAIALLAFGTGAIINYSWKGKENPPPVFAEIQVPFGQMTEMTLFDGTHVWLNSGTTLRYANNFGNKTRQVELEGEAFFKVEPGDIPFKVKIKNHEVEVLGTSFAAEAYPDEPFSQVTLIEGSVQINDRNGMPLKNLEPNQQLHIPDALEGKVKLRAVNPLFYESWINGQIRFDEERLEDVAKRMERWYNVEIRFACKEASDLRFTGTVLKNKPIDQSMKAISMLLPITVKHERNLASKDVINISKK